MVRKRRARLALAFGAVAVAAVFSTAVVAGTSGTIRGTAKADTLRGGPGADTIYGLGGNDSLNGLAGNDKLFGGPGNDKLAGGPGNDTISGGPGVDRISCGPGKDVAVGDAKDKATADCETKRGFAPPTPPAPPPTKAACENGKDDDGDGKVDYPADLGCDTTTDEDETDPPPLKKAQGGKYCGFTQQGPGICVTVSADGAHVEKFETTSIIDCPDGSRWQVRVTFSGRQIPLDENLAFEFSYTGPLTGGTNVTADEFVNGTFTEDGKASGTFALRKFAFDNEGKHLECTQGAVGWNVKHE